MYLPNNNSSKGSYHSILRSNGNCVIKSYGTKFSVISTSRSDRLTSRSINISLDNVKEIINGNGYNIDEILLYRKTDLPLELHTITINSSNDVNHRIIVDAIDIDDTGYLIPYDESIVLGKSIMDLKADD